MTKEEFINTINKQLREADEAEAKLWMGFFKFLKWWAILILATVIFFVICYMTGIVTVVPRVQAQTPFEMITHGMPSELSGWGSLTTHSKSVVCSYCPINLAADSISINPDGTINRDWCAFTDTSRYEFGVMIKHSIHTDKGIEWQYHDKETCRWCDKPMLHGTKKAMITPRIVMQCCTHCYEESMKLQDMTSIEIRHKIDSSWLYYNIDRSHQMSQHDWLGSESHDVAVTCARCDTVGLYYGEIK